MYLFWLGITINLFDVLILAIFIVSASLLILDSEGSNFWSIGDSKFFSDLKVTALHCSLPFPEGSVSLGNPLVGFQFASCATCPSYVSRFFTWAFKNAMSLFCSSRVLFWSSYNLLWSLWCSSIIFLNSVKFESSWGGLYSNRGTVGAGIADSPGLNPGGALLFSLEPPACHGWDFSSGCHTL